MHCNLNQRQRTSYIVAGLGLVAAALVARALADAASRGTTALLWALAIGGAVIALEGFAGY
jgi:hypothetical protein